MSSGDEMLTRIRGRRWKDLTTLKERAKRTFENLERTYIFTTEDEWRRRVQVAADAMAAWHLHDIGSLLIHVKDVTDV